MSNTRNAHRSLFSFRLNGFGTGGYSLFSCRVVPCHAQPPVVLPVIVLAGVCKENTLWSQENELQKAGC